MVGALLELVAKGGQDVYFICNPQISFFKKVYKRHTNFSIDYEKIMIDIDFGKATKFAIPRKGDLVKNMYLHFDLPNLSDDDTINYINFIGYNLIDYIEIFLGGTKVDKQLGEWLYIWNELKNNDTKKKTLYKMIGGHNIENYKSENGNKGGKYMVPLSFWFMDDISLSIPMVAMQYSEIEIGLKLKELNKLWISKTGKFIDNNFKIKKCELSIEYIYLDTKERKLFAQESHEYLIKQIQYSVNNNILKNETIKRFNLNFNHPVIELIFMVQNKKVSEIEDDKGNDWYNYSKHIIKPLKDPIKNATILFNGENRTPKLNSNELRLYNIYERHTNVPDNFIYLYSFSLAPEEYQPMGSCNFSRLDNKQIEIEFEENIETSELRIYALNYNVLRFSKGLCGVAYIN